MLMMAISCYANILHAEGNPDVGKTKSAACAGCHGQDGNSPAPTFPKLAGQHATYLARQLHEFKVGIRQNATMMGMVQGLSESDMEHIAAYYEQQKITPVSLDSLTSDDEDEDEEESSGDDALSNEELLKLGQNIYLNGNLETEVSACSACHGPKGLGNKPARFPVLRSQYPEYLMQSLNDYKSSKRANRSDNMMYMIAKRMTETEIKAVAYYISTR